MKIVNKTGKRGFTLVEMMLAIAIMMMVSVFFITMLWSIINGHQYVAYENDLADYAALNAQALEVKLLQATKIGAGDDYLYIPNNSLILTSDDDGPLFHVNEYVIRAQGDVELKYTMTASFNVNAETGEVTYLFGFHGTNGKQDFYSGTIYIPTASNISLTDVSNASSLYYS